MKIIKFTESVADCDCCGKSELKGTYVMQTDEGDIMYYGAVCGVKAAKYGSVKELKSATKQAEIDNKNAALSELYATVEAAFYQNYIGSKQHGIDMDEKGFSYVSGLIRPAKQKAAEIAAKYGIPQLFISGRA